MDQQQPVLPNQNQKSEVQQSTRSLWWLAVMLVAALGLGVWTWVGKGESNTNTSNANVASQNLNTAAANANVAAPTYTYPGQDGKTALELLKLTYPNTMTKTSGSLGEYVTGINGREAGSTEYWQLSVNGKSSDVGASTLVTKSTDMIEWKLTSF